MKKKAILLLQGGGALGAFQCGAWQTLQAFLREQEYELATVAGASVGAINAALITRHYHDAASADALLHFWRGTLTTPSMPFVPPVGEYGRAWNGVLTGLLFGNPALFRPAYPYWQPLADLFRLQMPLYDTQAARRTLERAFGRYRGNAPLLVIGATDIESGRNILFDSASRTITHDMVAASMAIPMLFPPIEIDGRRYWDGDMRSNSLLPDVLALLQRQAREPDAIDDYLVIVIDMLKPDADSLPSSTMQSHYRFANILLGGRLMHEQRAIEVGNAYIDALQRLHLLAAQEPDSPLAQAIEEEYRKVRSVSPARIELLHIGRSCQFDHEYISREFDYSPDYIERLIAQGAADASDALAGHLQARTARSPAQAITPEAAPATANGRRAGLRPI
jgi:NTE family protein